MEQFAIWMDLAERVPAAAMLRLARDLREVQANPLPNIAAEPHADNMRIWHVTFTAPDGPYSGVCFHMVMQYPAAYPSEPPRVKLCTMIPHPNVFEGYDFNANRNEPGCWICLNMLRNTNQGSNSGWSGAYSVYSIIMQLQSFLFAENIDQDYDPDYGDTESSEGFCRQAVEDAQAFHDEHGDKFPAIVIPRFNPFQNIRAGRRVLLCDLLPVAALTSASGGFELGELPDEVLLQIADQLPPQAVSALFRTCKAVASTLSRSQLAVRRELICFYSKAHFTEAVLGFGMHLEHGSWHAGGICGRHIKTISTELELLSQDAFETAAVRTSVWQKPFEFFLPVLLGTDHSQRALPLAKTNLMRISGYPVATAFDPMVVLTVLPKLLNQMTVSLMSADHGTSLHASEKALLGFTSFHHLLLKLASEHPVIQERAEFWVHEFTRSPARRSKLVIHDLGEFLVLLYLCREGTWAKLANHFLEETFVRNVRWILDEQNGDAGVLAVLELDNTSTYRLDRTLQASATSIRLLMFQAFFLRQVACPAGKTATQILHQYESSNGRPPPGTAFKLQMACKENLGELSWPKFFTRMGVGVPKQHQLCNTLRAAVRSSEARGYHSSASVDWKRLQESRAKADKAYQLPDLDSRSEVASSVSSLGISSSLRSSKKDGVAGVGNARLKLFIAGLQPRQTEEQLRQLCCSFGQPIAVQKQPGSRSAFIWFSRADEVDAALEYLREVLVCGRRLRVERAHQSQTRPLMRAPAPKKFGTPKCPHPPLSLAAKCWYKEHGRK